MHRVRGPAWDRTHISGSSFGYTVAIRLGDALELYAAAPSVVEADTSNEIVPAARKVTRNRPYVTATSPPATRGEAAPRQRRAGDDAATPPSGPCPGHRTSRPRPGRRRTPARGAGSLRSRPIEWGRKGVRLVTYVPHDLEPRTSTRRRDPIPPTLGVTPPRPAVSDPACRRARGATSASPLRRAPDFSFHRAVSRRRSTATTYSSPRRFLEVSVGTHAFSLRVSDPARSTEEA